MKKIGLFVHGAALTRRHGIPTTFEFEATHLAVQLHSFSDTSPFHDLPDGAHVYVEIGVDDFSQPPVKEAAEAFVRHGRRPKFGPPLAELPGDPYPDCDGCQRLEYEKREEVARLRQLLRDLVDFDMGTLPRYPSYGECLQSFPRYPHKLDRMQRAWKAAIAEVGPRNQQRHDGDAS